MITTVAIEEKGGTQKVARSRVGAATACYYPSSKRVVVVADRGDFADAEAAVRELRAHVTGGEYLGCMDCGHASYYPPLDGGGTPEP